MAGTSNGARKGWMNRKRAGSRKLSGRKVAFGQTKGTASTRVAARETNKMFARADRRKKS